MKLKFMLLPLAVFGLVVGSYADCTKNEIMKLIDTGYSKTEIKGICKRSEPKKEKSKWINPTQKVCKANGGKMNGYICKSNWSNAKNICSASGGRLPTIDELRKVITDCGGEIKEEDDATTEWTRNKKNTFYQACYKKKGFLSSNDYWSTTTNACESSVAWYVAFNRGDYWLSKTSEGSIRCVRTGQ